MRAFGILANHSPIAPEFLNNEILPRLAFLRMLLALVDHVDPDSAREAIASRDPVIYNTTEWPANAPLAGPFESLGNVTLEQHLTSWYLSWNFQLAEGAGAGMALKIIRA